ncbi:MAG TPA: lysylphosphatidylglycerol synthase transmembrane domain-containing protein [Tepidisphaeraceae bacterium]|jgi:hypothetical protein|nr:lysylphosphatidylglycerol synthase transmembrane domain-containing protein [Tepidisphaeraceae bacterium]
MSKHPKARKWITFFLRWGIAIAGIAWVLAKTPFRDRVLLVNSSSELMSARVLHEPAESAEKFEVIDPQTREAEIVNRADIWTQPDRRSVAVDFSGNNPRGPQDAKLLAIRPGAHHDIGAPPAELLVTNPNTGKPTRISPDKVPGGYYLRIPYPLVDIGLVRLVENARLLFLLGALLVLPISYFITSRRWHLLLEALDIHISQATAFVLNMVGSFYNSFMPGSTGGDLVKAYYAAKHTTHKVRAVLSVIVDRLIGVIALIILGGVMAFTQWSVPDCKRVAIGSAGLLLLTAVGLVVFYKRSWRQSTGLDWLLKHMPMQKQLNHAVEAMELYGRRPKAAFMALVMTFPVHITTIICGTLAGIAFGIDRQHMPLTYYWTVVPVITLVAAIPISPQGAGVMEAFAILLTKDHGVTVTQAIGLTNALRFGQMFWNLLAGLFVLRGGYHAPNEAEQEEMESDEPDAPNPDFPTAFQNPKQEPGADGSVQPI